MTSSKSKKKNIRSDRQVTLYGYVKPENKQFVKDSASAAGVSESLWLDKLFDELRKK